MDDVVLICGLKGTGKDTAAKFFTDRGYIKVSFADKLKDVVSTVFGWDRELLEGNTNYSRQFRETNDDWWAQRLGRQTFTPRIALQEIGTNIFRDTFNYNIWTLSLLKTLKTTERYVLTDVRFPNEIAFIENHFGENNVVTIRIRRYPEPDWWFLLREGKIKKPDNVHLSEYALVHQDVDHTFVNNGKISDLNRMIQLAFTDV